MHNGKDDEDEKLTNVLTTLELGNYFETFKEHGLNYEEFLDLNDNELKEMKIPIGPRKKIEREIKRLNDQPIVGKHLKTNYLDIHT